MDEPSHKELALIVDEFLMLVRESADYHTNRDVRAVLLEASRVLVATRRRLVVAQDRYVVAVVGLTNVGKSTLLNALLGAELAPRRNGPCTAAPIEFEHGDTLQVTVYNRRSLTRPSWPCDDAEAVHRRLASMADDADNCAIGEGRRIVVQTPNALLHGGLVIADTPGFGAAQVGAATGTHEASVKAYLTDDVSQVFWVVLAEQGIGKREMQFHDTFFADVCDDVVVTGCEDWTVQDRERFRRRFAESFGSRMPTFHFVSGLEGMRARQAKDAAALASAGITTLEDRIRTLARAEGRLAALQAGLLQLTDDLHAWLGSYRNEHRGKLPTWWRPDSWSRWRACLPSDQVKQQLMARLKEPS